MAICAPCPAICRMPTPGWAASTAFTPRGWLNPDSLCEHQPRIRGLAHGGLRLKERASLVSTPQEGAREKWHRDFHATALIRAVARWCFAHVSGLKGFAKRILPTRARRVSRSTQTYLDADHGPFRADHDGARKRRLGGAVAAVAGPRRPADYCAP